MGTVFFGGLDTSGDYMPDMVVALREVGVQNVALGSNDLIQMSGLRGSFLDQTIQAGLVMRYRHGPLDDFIPGDHLPMAEPENLVGYSFGGLIAAQIAHALPSVKRLFLIGCPIGGAFLAQLRANPRLLVVDCIDLEEHGDPLRAGMSDLDLMAALPMLTGQRLIMSGHFIHAQDGDQGAHNRRGLVKRLRAGGLPVRRSEA
ncbi:hypothetical protein [Magnetospira sp. QH-2]|uniref:hypothetical protein n=1 Tax=Magnetospira sp. (strain QH-2) TaxID=1288970 RepID=UPI0003E8150C|nr:hypothetical protein [Magnetospira sp. QH-2]CCQ72626.1 protein of unknown function [Magnetospira sp. QH-2]